MTTTRKRKALKPTRVDRAITAPYALRATSANVRAGRLSVTLHSGVSIAIPVAVLGDPWTKATSADLSRVRLRMDGSWLWWDALDEGLVLDEVVPAAFNLNPAAMLARRLRGRQATPAKAAAARRNGARGGRPPKQRKVA